jgi:hypothetical protein
MPRVAQTDIVVDLGASGCERPVAPSSSTTSMITSSVRPILASSWRRRPDRDEVIAYAMPN